MMRCNLYDNRDKTTYYLMEMTSSIYMYDPFKFSI